MTWATEKEVIIEEKIIGHINNEMLQQKYKIAAKCSFRLFACKIQV